MFTTDDYFSNKKLTKSDKKIDFYRKIDFLHAFLICICIKKMDKRDIVKAFFFMNFFTTHVTKMSEVKKHIH